jgi:hypothetical protein
VRRIFLLLLVLAVSDSACSVRVKIGKGENEAPGTLYLFNLNPPEHRIFVYEQLTRDPSWEMTKDLLRGGAPSELKQVAMVDGQRYAVIRLRPRTIMLRIAGEPAPLQTQRNFDPEHPGAGPIFEPFPISVDSEQRYYALAYSRSLSEKVRNFLFKVVSAIPLSLLQEKWQGLGDISVQPISEDNAQQLMASLKPQSP